MKKLLMLFLILSCFKNLNNLKIRNKGIEEDLVKAIIDNEKDKALDLIKRLSNLNYRNVEDKSFLHLALQKGNLDIIKALLNKGLNLENEDDITKIYDLAIGGDYSIINILNKKRYNLKEKSINNNKYFCFLCYSANFEEVKKFIIKKNIDPKSIKDIKNRNGLIIASIGGKKDIVEMFIKEYNFYVNEENIWGSTALIEASKAGHKDIVIFLLENKANVNKPLHTKWSALMAASEKGHKEIVKVLIDWGADVNAKNQSGWTALITASYNGHLDIVRILIERGSDINIKTSSGWTPLMYASKNGHKEILDLLLKRGANINDVNNEGATALIEASYTSQKEIVELLINNGANVNCKKTDGWTPLMFAANNGNLEIVKLLSEAGGDINHKDNYGNTAIIYASGKGFKELVKFLISKSVNINHKNNEEATALIFAAQNGYKDIIELLLEKGANVNDAKKDGWTALMAASEKGDKNILNFLLERKLDINAKNQGGWTALMVAAYIGDKDVLEILLKKGADINAEDNDGATPLIKSLHHGHLDISKLLIEKGANINASKEDGWTSLMTASEKGHQDLVSILLIKGASINSKNKDGWTALMKASYSGHLEIVRILIEKGANIDDKNSDGWTSLMISSQNGHKDIVDLLLKKGADINHKNKDGWTALMAASEKGQKDTVKILIHGKVDINAKNRGGWTALMTASYNGHVEIVKILIEKKANIDDKNNESYTSLIFAAQNGHKEIVILLIAKGANFNFKSGRGYTALMYASGNGHKEIAELLIENGANINDADDDGATSLIKSSYHGHLEVVKLLLEKGASINSAKKDGCTALILSSYKGHKDIVKLLLENGAIVNQKDNNGNTALFKALNAGKRETANLLIENFCQIDEDMVLDNIIEEALIENIKKNKPDNYLLIANNYYNRLNLSYIDNEGNTLLHYAAISMNYRLFNLFLNSNIDINILNKKGETPLYVCLSQENIIESFVWYLINNGAILKPNSYIKDKVLVDVLSPYKEICNKLVYEPLTLKLLDNINIGQNISSKIKEIIRVLRLKEEDFLYDMQMMHFIKNILIVKNNYKVEIDSIKIKIEDNRDVDLNIEVFDEIFIHFKHDDYCDSVISFGIEKAKNIFRDRLNRIKNAQPLAINYDSSEEDRAKYIDFITKKRLYKLLMLVSITADNGRNNEKIRMAINELLDHLVCRNGSLEAINAAITYLSGEENTELKDIINEELMTLRYELLKEVVNEEINKNNVTLEVEGAKYRAELTGHLLSHLTLNIGNELKIKPSYDEYNIEYKYNRSYIIQEVLKRYNQKLVKYIRDKIEENRSLWNKVRDHIERDIFKGKSILQIEDFIYSDKDYKINEEVTKALLIHLNFLIP